MSPVNVLVVEDNPADQRLIAEAFRRYNGSATIYVVGDGSAALDFLHRRDKYANAAVPSLIILDLNLPKKSGLEVLKELKQNPKLKSIPVVIFSTTSIEEDMKHCYESHANAFVTKPSELDAFHSAIKSIQDFWIRTAQLPKQ